MQEMILKQLNTLQIYPVILLNSNTDTPNGKIRMQSFVPIQVISKNIRDSLTALRLITFGNTEELTSTQTNQDLDQLEKRLLLLNRKVTLKKRISAAWA